MALENPRHFSFSQNHRVHRITSAEFSRTGQQAESRLPQPFPAEVLAGLSRAMRGALSNRAWRLDIPLSSRHSLAMKLLFIQRR